MKYQYSCTLFSSPSLVLPLLPVPSSRSSLCTRYMRSGSNAVACVLLEAMMYTLTFGAVLAGAVVAHLEFANVEFGAYRKGGYVFFPSAEGEK